jgi:L-ascorbate metabolism protein UlaG (beta-lactamase superfamily)
MGGTGDSMKTRMRFEIAILMAAVIFLLAGCSSTVQAGEGKLEQGKSNHQTTQEEADTKEKVRTADTDEKGKLLYMGHASIRITTPEDKVIYIDPFAGDGDDYAPAADLILETHGHYDHTALDKIANRNEDCQVITWEEALEGGQHQSFDLGYAKIEAVEAGYNTNHNVNECVGYVITLSDGVKVYVSGDTSTTEQMPSLADQNIDYAFFCCDGVYNMDLEEAAECAALVQAKHNIPYHIVAANSGSYFDHERAEQFNADHRLIIDEGEEIDFEK